MKKIFALILASSLVFSLAACGGGNANNAAVQTPTPTSAPADNAPDDSASAAGISGNSDSTDTAAAAPEHDFSNISGNLTIGVAHDPTSEALIAAFTAKYPNVNVEYQTWDLDEEHIQALAGPTGTGADVFVIGNNAITAALKDGLLEPFPSDLQAKYQNTIRDNALQMFTIDGKLYGAPIDLEPMGLFYNKDLVATPPTSFEQIIDFAKTYNDPSADKYALRWEVNNPFFNYFIFTSFGWQLFGPNGDDYRQFNIDSPSVTQALEFFKSLHDIYPVNAVDTTVETTDGDAFANGEVPFTISGAWQFPIYDAANLNYGVTKLPTINGVQGRCFAASMMTCVSSYSQNSEAAFAFADFCTSEEGATILWNGEGHIPALKDISGIPGLSDNEHVKGLLEQAPYTDVTVSSNPEINLILADPMTNLLTYVWDGTLSIPDAQAKAASEYEAALNAIGESMNDPK